MNKFSNIAELIEVYEAEINTLNVNIATLKKKPQSFNERVLFNYIDTGSTGKTKEHFRALDIKSERGTYFSSGDVSKLLKDGADDISPELLAIARKVNILKKKSGSKR